MSELSPVITVTDNPSAQRFEIRKDTILVGFATYRRQDNRITFLHTEIDHAFSGQGLGSELVRQALDTARAEGKTVLPLCPFVAHFIQEHTEYHDLTSQNHDNSRQ